MLKTVFPLFQDVHIIRDHPNHDIPMMGGIWGAKLTRKTVRNSFSKSMKALFRSELFNASQEERSHDQAALQRFIW
jgi:hypothetical protein